LFSSSDIYRCITANICCGTGAFFPAQKSSNESSREENHSGQNQETLLQQINQLGVQTLYDSTMTI
jgi:hypothetical protein